MVEIPIHRGYKTPTYHVFREAVLPPTDWICIGLTISTRRRVLGIYKTNEQTLFTWPGQDCPLKYLVDYVSSSEMR